MCDDDDLFAEDDPPEFSGRPNTGGRMDRTDTDANFTVREQDRPKYEKDLDRGPAMDARARLAFDKKFPDVARLPILPSDRPLPRRARPVGLTTAQSDKFAALLPNASRVRSM